MKNRGDKSGNKPASEIVVFSVSKDTQCAFVAAFAAAIREHFPSCPTGSEAQIAEHACRKYSGRVGRTAAAKALSPEAIRLAVIAHIRHIHTNYDTLLGRFGDRESARSEVRAKVADIVGRWEQTQINI